MVRYRMRKQIIQHNPKPISFKLTTNTFFLLYAITYSSLTLLTGFDLGDNEPFMEDGHHRTRLTFLIDQLRLVQQNTEKDRDYVLRKMNNAIANLEGTLTPKWQERDEVKGRMGEPKWKGNRNPSNEYSNKRKADEKEVRELREALFTVENLRISSE